jgi:pimeloyl-ACP methyl ester carboxylesterase
MGLLPGFGSSTKVANSYAQADWENAVAGYVDLMSLCYRKIHLVGFSIGGGLVSHFLLTNPGMSPEGLVHAAHGDVRVQSATLLAPYYGTGSGLTAWLASQIHEQLGVAGIPIQTLYNALLWLNLQSAGTDLKALASFPSSFNDELPLVAAEEVQRLGAELRAIAPQRKTKVPVFFSYSESDRTIDQQLARRFVHEHFSSFNPAANQLVIARAKNVPHQIQLKSWNPELDSLLARITAHMQANQ